MFLNRHHFFHCFHVIYATFPQPHSDASVCDFTAINEVSFSSHTNHSIEISISNNVTQMTLVSIYLTLLAAHTDPPESVIMLISTTLPKRASTAANSDQKEVLWSCQKFMVSRHATHSHCFLIANTLLWHCKKTES